MRCNLSSLFSVATGLVMLGSNAVAEQDNTEHSCTNLDTRVNVTGGEFQGRIKAELDPFCDESFLASATRRFGDSERTDVTFEINPPRETGIRAGSGVFTLQGLAQLSHTPGENPSARGFVAFPYRIGSDARYVELIPGFAAAVGPGSDVYALGFDVKAVFDQEDLSGELNILSAITHTGQVGLAARLEGKYPFNSGLDDIKPYAYADLGAGVILNGERSYFYKIEAGIGAKLKECFTATTTCKVEIGSSISGNQNGSDPGAGLVFKIER